MAEGSMRCDINISLRERGTDTLGTRTEIKNVNSFRFVERAIHVEYERQADILDSGGRIIQETRLFDPDQNVTRSMRSKEVANDYRYFPEPDLLPIEIDSDYIEAVRATLPELPSAKRDRFVSDYGLSEYDATLLVPNHAMASFFEAVVDHCKAAKPAANWILGDLSGALNRADITIEHSPLSAQQLAGLINRIEDGTLSSKLAKQVFDAMWEGLGDADEIIDSRGLKQVSDAGALETMVAEVIAANPDQVAQYLAADEAKRKKLSGFFVGQIMKASQGQANPQLLNQLLLEKLTAQS
jgi:aspartyl-tRNA(Asn)/glutamyl-tRNA(Gln) amidotransferase subunit B